MLDKSQEAHYIETLGSVQHAIAALSEMSPVALEAYTTIRKQLYEPREDGLDLRTKELVFVILDIGADNIGGAKIHLEAAHRAGLTTAQLQEALTQTMMVLGIAKWTTTSLQIWDHWQELG